MYPVRNSAKAIIIRGGRLLCIRKYIARNHNLKEYDDIHTRSDCAEVYWGDIN
jgi:hypothetical protein